MSQSAHIVSPGTDASRQTLIDELKSRHTLADVVRSIPAECFRRSRLMAYGGLAMTILAVALGYASVTVMNQPWFLPIFWIYTGTAMTGLFMLGHDCAHMTFSASRAMNTLIGHLVLLPLFYPFHGWRVSHNRHHAYTNHAQREEAWKPMSVDEYRALGSLGRLRYWCYRGYFWWLGTVYYEFAVTLNPWEFNEGKDRNSVWASTCIVGLYMMAFFPVVVSAVGVSGLIIYFVVPWLVFHFWNSTFTLIHHTHPDIPYEPEGKWSMVSGQLYSTVHCTYPRWVEFLCHDISVHIPHHVSTAIPSYNLRRAYTAIREKWGPYVHETRFSWNTMSDIFNKCYLRDDEGRYVPGRPLFGKVPDLTS